MQIYYLIFRLTFLSYIIPCQGLANDARLHDLQAAKDGWKELGDISERAAIASLRIPGVHGDIRCNCKGFCTTNACSCFKNGRLCTFLCHPGRGCSRCLNVLETPTLQTAAAAPSNTNPVVVAQPTVAVASTPITVEDGAGTPKRTHLRLMPRRVRRMPGKFINDVLG